MSKEISLRLHHIKNLQQILDLGSEQYSINMLQGLILMSREAQSYQDLKDRIGHTTNLEFMNSYALRFAKALYSYLLLPDTQALKLIAIGKDLACQQTAKGEHCNRLGFISAELTYLDDLKDIKSEYNIGGNLVEFGKRKTPNHYALTTIGVIRQVISIKDKRLLK